MPRWLDFIISPLSAQEQKPDERRAVNRLHVPICPRCHARKNVFVTARYLGAVYFTCQPCNEIIALSKPKA